MFCLTFASYFATDQMIYFETILKRTLHPAYLLNLNNNLLLLAVQTQLTTTTSAAFSHKFHERLQPLLLQLAAAAFFHLVSRMRTTFVWWSLSECSDQVKLWATLVRRPCQSCASITVVVWCGQDNRQFDLSKLLFSTGCQELWCNRNGPQEAKTQ